MAKGKITDFADKSAQDQLDLAIKKLNTIVELMEKISQKKINLSGEAKDSGSIKETNDLLKQQILLTKELEEKQKLLILTEKQKQEAVKLAALEQKKSIDAQKEEERQLKKNQVEAEKKAAADAKMQNVTVSLRTELRNMVQQLAQLELAGKGNTKEFAELAMKAGKLQDTLSDTRGIVKALGSDTKYISGLIGGVQGLVGAFSAFQAVMSLTGSENEDLQKSMQKLMALMTIMQGVQQVANALQKESAFMGAIMAGRIKAQAYWTNIQTIATSNATIAQKGLNIAMSSAGGLYAIVAAAVIYLAKTYYDGWKAREKFNEDPYGSKAKMEIYIASIKSAAEATKEFTSNLNNLSSAFENLNAGGLKTATDQYANLVKIVDAGQIMMNSGNKGAVALSTGVIKLGADIKNFTQEEATEMVIKLSDLQDSLMGSDEATKLLKEAIANAISAIGEQNKIIDRIRKKKEEADKQANEDAKKIIEERNKFEKDSYNEIEKIRISNIKNEKDRNLAQAAFDRDIAFQKKSTEIKESTLSKDKKIELLKEFAKAYDVEYLRKIEEINKKSDKSSIENFAKRFDNILKLAKEFAIKHNEISKKEAEANKFISDILLEDEKTRLAERLRLIDEEEKEKLLSHDWTEKEKSLISKHYTEERHKAELEAEKSFREKIVSQLADRLKIKPDEAQQILDTYLKLGKDIIDGMMKQREEAITDRLNAELEAAQKSNEIEKARLDEQKEAGLLTEEEYNRGILLSEQKMNKAKNDADKKAFEDMKSYKLAELWINAAVAAISALATANNIYVGLALSAATLITAGIEADKISSQSWTPKYAKGRKDGKAEFAIVGEEGTELIKLKSGQEFLTPNKATKVFLPEGAQVIPNPELVKMMAYKQIVSGNQSNNTVDFSELKSEFRQLNATIKSKPEFNPNLMSAGKFFLMTEKNMKYVERHRKS